MSVTHGDASNDMRLYSPQSLLAGSSHSIGRQADHSVYFGGMSRPGRDW